MDIATIIGLIGGAVLVVLAIFTGGDILIFINVPGLLIVVGGTIATCFIKFSLADVINSFRVAMKAFMVKIEPPDEIMGKMVAIAKVAKERGLMALENEKPDDEFAAKAFQFLADGFDEEQIKELLKKDINLTIQRHLTGQKVFKGMGGSAPAFGMIGTLIGLVQMLANMANPQDIGPAMAVALLTTLYGALIANLVCLPLADKLALRSQQELENKNLILDAALGIARGLSGMVFTETLKIHLSPKDRLKLVPKSKSGGAQQ
ncbi:MAG: MotA/TolQ/ExbB proton channel family protein [Desulfobacterales bacterium]|nr:MotA/TolQ/ExbB proton channel family protein [Desulfobacterales bacterium]